MYQRSLLWHGVQCTEGETTSHQYFLSPWGAGARAAAHDSMPRHMLLSAANDAFACRTKSTRKGTCPKCRASLRAVDAEEVALRRRAVRRDGVAGVAVLRGTHLAR